MADTSLNGMHSQSRKSRLPATHTISVTTSMLQIDWSYRKV